MLGPGLVVETDLTRELSAGLRHTARMMVSAMWLRRSRDLSHRPRAYRPAPALEDGWHEQGVKGFGLGLDM